MVEFLAQLFGAVSVFDWSIVALSIFFLIVIFRGVVSELELRSIRRDFRLMSKQKDRGLIKKRSWLKTARLLRAALWEEWHCLDYSTLCEDAKSYSQRVQHPAPYFGAQLSKEEVHQLILNDAMERFGADSVAFISNTNSTSSVQVLISLRRGIVGERLRKALADRYQSFFIHHDQSSVGFTDHHLEEDRVINISLFGFRFSLSGIVMAEQEHVVWLGYSEKNRNASDLQLDFAKYISELTRALREYSQIKSMQLKYVAEKEQSDERAKLLAYASHDMRSPINNLRAIIRLLSFPDEIDNHDKHLGSAFRNCDLLAEIVDDALDYSRFKAGALNARKEQVSCAEVIEKVLYGFLELAHEKGLAVINQVTTAVILHADSRQIARIVSNVIGNAIKYTNRGSIHISAQAGAAGRVSLVVRDTGVGMLEADIREMFSPYKRFGDQSIQGEGLGLALSKVFAELNDCQFKVDSTRGVGTTVTLDMPGEVIEQRRSNAQDDSLANVSSGSVLIVDDQKSARDSLRRVLELYGFSVEAVASVHEAISFLRYSQPTVLITDLTFPEADGEELVRSAVVEKLCERVIIVSGRDLRDDKLYLLNANEVVFLKKPIDFSALVSVIGSMTKGSHSPISLCA